MISESNCVDSEVRLTSSLAGFVPTGLFKKKHLTGSFSTVASEAAALETASLASRSFLFAKNSSIALISAAKAAQTSSSSSLR